MEPSILNRTGKPRGRRWRIVRVIDIPLGGDEQYQRATETIWEHSCRYRHVPEDLRSIIAVVLGYEIHTYRYLWERYTGVWYILQVRRWGKWHTRLQVQQRIVEMIQAQHEHHR